MRAGFDVLGLNRFGVRQEWVLAQTHPLKPGDAFLALACLALRVALISLGCEVVALGLVCCAWGSLRHFPRAPALLASFALGSQLLQSLTPLRPSPHR